MSTSKNFKEAFCAPMERMFRQLEEEDMNTVRLPEDFDELRARVAKLEGDPWVLRRLRDRGEEFVRLSDLQRQRAAEVSYIRSAARQRNVGRREVVEDVLQQIAGMREADPGLLSYKSVAGDFVDRIKDMLEAHRPEPEDPI